MRRRGRSTLDKPQTLEALKRGRDGTIMVSRSTKINGPAYRKADAARIAIDELAEEITGDDKALWPKPHTT